jgi:hypothetical protein
MSIPEYFLKPVLCKVNYLREQSAHFSDVKTAIGSVYSDIVVSLKNASNLFMQARIIQILVE